MGKKHVKLSKIHPKTKSKGKKFEKLSKSRGKKMYDKHQVRVTHWHLFLSHRSHISHGFLCYCFGGLGKIVYFCRCQRGQV